MSDAGGSREGRGSAPTRRVIFVLFDGCEILDFAGPMQAFDQANAHAEVYEVKTCALTATIRTAQGLEVAGLLPLEGVRRTDLVMVPGYPVRTVDVPEALTGWLSIAHASGARVCSVCTGAFALGQAGLLDGRECTTHWKLTDELQARYPDAKVIGERLFVEDGSIVTSAGIASGIDLALALIEEDLGPATAAAVARELVVYIRRDAFQRQESIYLDYRTHMNVAVHTVQDWILAHPTEPTRLPELASIAHMSVRNLTRTYRGSTGISIHEFRTRVRLERARTLMNDPDLTLEAIAVRSGFAGGQQLRRQWRQTFGTSPVRARLAPQSPSSVPGILVGSTAEAIIGHSGMQGRAVRSVPPGGIEPPHTV